MVASNAVPHAAAIGAALKVALPMPPAPVVLEHVRFAPGKVRLWTHSGRVHEFTWLLRESIYASDERWALRTRYSFAAGAPPSMACVPSCSWTSLGGLRSTGYSAFAEYDRMGS
jgi:hypothetical protein